MMTSDNLYPEVTETHLIYPTKSKLNVFRSQLPLANPLEYSDKKMRVGVSDLN